MSFSTRLARIGYVLGTALAVAAIIYFFASNWGGLERGQKTLLAVCLTAGFYLLSFLPAKLPLWRKHGDYLPLVFLFAGTCAFGATTALLDQIYNAHVDNWRLFAVWFVPAALFSLLLRNVWFYLLSYVLGHLSIWLMFYPATYHIQYSDWQQAGIFGLFAAINLALFVLDEFGYWRAGFLKRLALGLFLFASVWLSNSFVLNEVGYVLNVLSVAILAACFTVFAGKRNTWALSMTALAASFFAILKFLELMEDNYTEWFFVFGLLFVALLLTGNVLFFRFVARLERESEAETDGGAGDADPAKEPGTDESGRKTAGSIAGPEEKPLKSSAARVVSTIVTIVGTAIGTISLIGLIMLVGGNWDDPELVVFTASVLMTGAMLVIPRMNASVRNTIMLIGLLAGNISAIVYDSIWTNLVILALSVAGWIRLGGFAPKMFAYFVINVSVCLLCVQQFDWYGNDFTWTLILLAAGNGLAYGLHGFSRSPANRRPLEIGGLVFTFLVLFWLTFMEDVFKGSHALFNILYFVLATLLLVRSVRRKRHWETSLLMAFWLAFVGFKYYDWLWTLLHKSMTLLLAGLVMIAASAWLDRLAGRKSPDDGQSGSGHDETGLAEGETPEKPARLLPYRKWAAVLLIIVLQFAYVGGLVAAREYRLANGTSIKLELMPVDPRSFMQGDYMALRYNITGLPAGMADRLRDDGVPSGKRLRLVLRADTDGIYQIDRLYRQGDTLRAGEVMIIGRFDGWGNVYYGIESYFIEEGTGNEWQERARFAEVIVSANGNPLLKELLEK